MHRPGRGTRPWGLPTHLWPLKKWVEGRCNKRKGDFCLAGGWHCHHHTVTRHRLSRSSAPNLPGTWIADAFAPHMPTGTASSLLLTPLVCPAWSQHAPMVPSQVFAPFQLALVLGQPAVTCVACCPMANGQHQPTHQCHSALRAAPGPRSGSSREKHREPLGQAAVKTSRAV